MKENREKRMAIAARIYDLDSEVYKCLGSSLGRVFTADREFVVKRLAALMCGRDNSHVLRSELALISNMARTIPNKSDRARLMTEYNNVLHLVESLPESFGSVDILDETLAQNNLVNRFAEAEHFIICISRTYGCAGTDIGFALADALKINYYDTEIFLDVLDRLEAERDSVEDSVSYAHGQYDAKVGGQRIERPLKRKASWFREFSRYHGLSQDDAIFFNQSDLLYDMARTEDFIVMGRCADVILSNRNIPHISIFINAPFEQRVRRTMQTDNLTEKQARHLLKKLDREHRHYYGFYTGRKWGTPINYDLCINSASYGIEGSVQLIERMIDSHLKAAPITAVPKVSVDGKPIPPQEPPQENEK